MPSPPWSLPGGHRFRSKWLVIRSNPLAVVRIRWPPGPPPGEPRNRHSAVPGLLLPFSHWRYYEFSGNQANGLRGTAFMEMEFLERLNKTTFTNTLHSVRNTDFCIFLQYLPGEIGISQISREVLQKYVKVSVWSRGYCIFENRFWETLLQLHSRKCNTLEAKCLIFNVFAMPPM